MSFKYLCTAKQESNREVIGQNPAKEFDVQLHGGAAVSAVVRVTEEQYNQIEVGKHYTLGFEPAAANDAGEAADAATSTESQEQPEAQPEAQKEAA